MNVKYIPKGK